MKIYESLKGVLTEEQLSEFKSEVEKAIVSAVEEKTAKMESLAESYVNEKLEEKRAEMDKELEEKKAALEAANEKELNENLEEFAKKLREKIREEFEQKAKEEDRVTLEQFKAFEEKFMIEEQKAVNALDKFLDEQIASKISTKLIKESVVSEELMSIVDGVKALLEEHYSNMDPTAGMKRLRGENTNLTRKVDSLSEQVEALKNERADLRRQVEKATTSLLISEKTRDLSDARAKEVKTFFEGRGFDFVKSRIDDVVEMTEEAESNSSRRPVRHVRPIVEASSVDDFLEEKRPDVFNGSGSIVEAANRFI